MQRSGGEGVVGGLDDNVACTTSICSIDGEHGELRYRGYEIRDLVRHARFADVAQLLWLGHWPSHDEQARFDSASRARCELPAQTRALMDTIPRATHPLAIVRTAISIEGALDPSDDDVSPAALHDKATTAYARTATLVGVLVARARGEAPSPPRDDLPRNANLLWVANGAEPDGLALDALDALCITYAEHELNPSSFTSRTVSGTRSDYWSAITAAVAAFKGPLHGGIFRDSVELLLRLRTPAAVPSFIEDVSATDAAVPGFSRGHVYETRDPRVAGMEQAARSLASALGAEELFETAQVLERGLAERRGLRPTSDLYGSLVMHLLGIPEEVFSSLIVASRFAGWTAHICEQHLDGTIIRPRARYVGPGPREVAHG